MIEKRAGDAAFARPLRKSQVASNSPEAVPTVTVYVSPATSSGLLRITRLKESSGAYEISVLPFPSVTVISVPASCVPAVSEITPCSELVNVWAMPEAPVPMKVPPVMTAVESKSSVDVSPCTGPFTITVPPEMAMLPFESIPSPEA